MKPVGQEQLQHTYLVEIPSWAETLEQSLSLCIDVVVCSVFNASAECQCLSLVSLITQDAQGLKRCIEPFIPGQLANKGPESVLLLVVVLLRVLWYDRHMLPGTRERKTRSFPWLLMLPSAMPRFFIAQYAQSFVEVSPPVLGLSLCFSALYREWFL